MDLLETVSVVLLHVVYTDRLGIVSGQLGIISLVLHQGVCSIGIAALEI